MMLASRMAFGLRGASQKAIAPPRRSLATSSALLAAAASEKKRIAVLGGGIAGLTSAYRLAQQLPQDRYDVVLLEQQSRLGGWIQSQRLSLPSDASTSPSPTALVEMGPRSIRPAGYSGLVMLQLVQSLGLLERLLRVPKTAPSAQNRYLYFPDRLAKLPSSIPSLLSALFKLPFLRAIVPSIMREPRVPSRFLRPRSESQAEKKRLQQRELLDDESVDSFVSRRFGKGVAENLVSAVIHGIYAGDTRKLSVRAVMPFLWEAERVHGSVLRSMLPAKRNKRHRPLPEPEAAAKAAKEDRLKHVEQQLGKQLVDSFKGISVYSFPEGVQEIVAALEQRLAALPNVQLRTNESVRAISIDESGKLTLTTASGESIEADRVISSIPSSKLADILPSDELPHLKHNPAANVAVVNVVISPSAAAEAGRALVPVQGFGYLIPRTTPDNEDGILGVVFDSDAVPDQDAAEPSRRPVKLTVMMGGAHWAGLEQLPGEDEVKARAVRALSRQLGIDADLLRDASKVTIKATMQHECIPWYLVGHPVRMAQLHKALAGNADLAHRLTLVGASYTGVSLNDCVAYATEAVEQIVAAELHGDDQTVTGLASFAIPPPAAPVAASAVRRVAQRGTAGLPSQGLVGPASSATMQFARALLTRRAFSTCRPLHEEGHPAAPAPTAVVGEKANKSLREILLDSVRASGPMTVSTYMRTCLLDPMQGYYASANSPATEREVLGSRGDFITSPEISQVFGELLAIFYLARWQAVGSPTSTRLVELGPGKGTLLADMLRTFASFRPFMATLKRIQLVETSAGLMELQLSAIRDALAAAGKRVVDAEEEVGEDGVVVEWFPSVDMVPIVAEEFSIVTAHEFFDALPTHIFEKHVDGKFREVLVGIKPKSSITVLRPGQEMGPAKEELGFVLSPTPTPWAQMLVQNNPRFAALQPGQRVEVSPESWAVARRVGELVAGRPASPPRNPAATEEQNQQYDEEEQQRLAANSAGGVGLIIDYGGDQAYGASFRAFKQHALVDVFQSPGAVDLTVNVDFLHLKSALHTTNARYAGPIDQADLLVGMGLQMRVDRLLQGKDDAARKRIIDAANRLIDETGMGVQYKALAVAAAPVPPADPKVEVRDKTADPDMYPFEFEQ
ncbi:DUF185-domain-containing protein [Moesziomyces antarcticus]|uniref:Related to HEM14 - Protoporphyrinogen oxidase involved in heme biosynthetic pathway n=2 Tax=Pseudozyma antarctica TaxID=84753 RepID=A0A5C3FT66_PSEA2|nr:DUF185-domain-containing protein [Moesziomyces antarcticus]GAK68420.1 DUF185-domain-containing protein [Moesziomyces antarcticus]SPO47340.1 related to HEM14 - Protoporphyrinogen oxidase involved in heme biosynthetic pathway [Moesziomyces antarcticus]